MYPQSISSHNYFCFHTEMIINDGTKHPACTINHANIQGELNKVHMSLDPGSIVKCPFSVSRLISNSKGRNRCCSHLVVACWGGRSASQMAEHSSSGWLWHFARSTYLLLLKYLSSSLSSRHSLQIETQQRDGTGIHGPWGSQWPHFHHRVQRKWRQSCSKEINTKGHIKV